MKKPIALCLLIFLTSAQNSQPLNCYGYGQVLVKENVSDLMHDDYIRVNKYKVGQIISDDK